MTEYSTILLNNLEQVFMCCELRTIFSEYSIFHNYQGFYNGDRVYQFNESGENVNPNKHQRIHLKVISMGKAFIKAQILVYIIVSLLERRHGNVVTMAKLLTCLQNSLNSRDLY